MSDPRFKISGQARREKKKELGMLKRSVRMFWFFEDIDRVYGSGVSDEEAELFLNATKVKIKVLETELKQLA